ncbi:MAG: glycosyltransferase family 2 protein [Bacilli bacterium]|nr:glycosyltransferase family 2 protein [Bacilli bacterium]
MNYKIYVYAISKNEEKFVNRWMDSVKEADGIFVLDTGSTDNTVELLKKKGAVVKKKIFKKFRFDEARNLSLKMVPKDADICLCIDIDEVLEDNWREKLENIWEKGLTRLRYNYIWSHNKYGNPAINFYSEKIHSRNGYRWIHPVHEILIYDGTEKIKTVDNFTISHYPDNKKSRSSYLPLLELSIKEDPKNDRNMHYLGREYMYYKMYNKSIDTLIKHLNLDSATWKDERSASMRFIARNYKSLKRFDEARMWLSKAKNETPYLREPYVESGMLEYELKNYENAIKDLEIALKNKKPYKSYINEAFCYDGTIYDILSICKFYTGKIAEALYYIDLALEKKPKNKRILNNKKLIKKALKNENNKN